MRLHTNRCVSGLWKSAVLTIALLFAAAACSDDAGVQSDSGGASPTQAATAAPASPTQAATAAPASPTQVATVAPVDSKLSIVATTNFVADWARNVGGDQVDVFSLLSVGSDPHSFRPGARDVARIADADLVLSVGLGLEESWLLDLLQNAARDPSTVAVLGDVVEPIESAAMDDHADEEGHDHEEDDHADEEGHDHDEDDHADEEGHDHDEDDHADEEGHDHDEDDHADEEGHDHDEDDHADEEGHDHDEDDHADEEGHDEDDHADEEGHDHEEDDHADEEGHGHHDHAHGPEDPHFWFDPIRVKRAINDIAARLSVLDPGRGDIFRANAEAYNARLDELHAWTLQQVGVLPMERRVLVTSHDSLRYFAQLYGFEVVGTVIPSLSTEVEPSAARLADLVEDVRESGAPAVFGETTVSERLAQAVSSEAGVELVRIYSGSLGAEGSGAETYIGMVRTNVTLIVDALR